MRKNNKRHIRRSQKEEDTSASFKSGIECFKMEGMFYSVNITVSFRRMENIIMLLG
jgi:hypothetical protein